MANKTYHIITIGCQMNKSDSERAAGYLEEHGFKHTGERSRADLVIVNTCGVRQSAEDRVYGLVDKIRRENPEAKIVITGCLAERDDVKKKLANTVDIWLPIIELPRFMDKLQKDSYLSIAPKYSSNISAYIPIGNGCNNFCSYCVVPYARGREVWRPAEEILDEVRGLVERGYKEITLIAQNVNSYKSQILDKFKIQNSKFTSINFAVLLKLINNVPGNFWIRFATSHPKDMSEELIKVIVGCEKICRHIHLPVQAGDDEVLRRMNRGYTVENYKKLIKKIRHSLPGAAITTDVIVGFPGETEEQFANTVKLFEEVKFDMAYIAQYSPRPGTAAAKLDDDVPHAEKKRRERVLTDILRRTALENNKKYVGKTMEVLVEGKNRRGGWYGKTKTGKVVEVRSKEDLTGCFVGVEIIGVRDFGLSGILMATNF